jgi:hypothetical protein
MCSGLSRVKYYDMKKSSYYRIKKATNKKEAALQHTDMFTASSVWQTLG